MAYCINCDEQTAQYSLKYCSNQCQSDYQFYDYIKRWKDGKVTGSRGINAKNISRHLIRYLLEKYKSSCSLCNWNAINITTGSVPLEVDHIDGDSENNSEENLRLLCPNCHSLTPNFRNLNKGHGRDWRRQKYLKQHG